MKENKGKEPCIFCAFILDWLTPMDCRDTINMIGNKIRKRMLLWANFDWSSSLLVVIFGGYYEIII